MLCYYCLRQGVQLYAAGPPEHPGEPAPVLLPPGKPTPSNPPIIDSRLLFRIQNLWVSYYYLISVVPDPKI